MTGSLGAKLVTSEVDGVATWAYPSGRPLLQASLVFRTGIADEPLPRRGWTHLLEHMALHAPPPLGLRVNGSVSLLFTTIDVEGPSEDVAAYLSEVTRPLATIDPDHVARESRMLRAEAALRGTGAWAASLAAHYGASGPGASAFLELGLHGVEPEPLAVWASAAFARDNAVLCLNGDVPAGLTLVLPDGPRRDTPMFSLLHRPRPGSYHHDWPDPLLSAIVHRSSAAAMAMQIADARVFSSLRGEAGISYAPSSAYEPIGRVALVTMGADVGSGELGHAVRRLFDVANALAIEGPDDGELTAAVARQTAHFSDPVFLPGLAWAAGQEHLLGRPTPTAESLIAECRDVTASSVRDVFAHIVEGALVGVPATTPSSDLPGQLQPSLGPGSTVTATAERFHLKWAFADTGDGRHTLHITDEALQATSPPPGRKPAMPHVSTVAWNRVAGVLVWPDGKRLLVGGDGNQLAVEPNLWAHGPQLVDRIDELTPLDVRIPMPAREAGEIPRPPGVAHRLTSIGLRVGVYTVPFAVFIFAITLVGPRLPAALPKGLFLMVAGLLAWGVRQSLPARR